jgi:DNA-directed RNA polymerase subunit omega
MAPREQNMMYPPIEELLNKVDSKFALVALAAKRGRQVNSYYNQLGEGLGAIVPPQVTSVSRKPLSIALEAIAANKITYAVPDEAEEAPK